MRKEPSIRHIKLSFKIQVWICLTLNGTIAQLWFSINVCLRIWCKIMLIVAISNLDVSWTGSFTSHSIGNDAELLQHHI